MLALLAKILFFFLDKLPCVLLPCEVLFIFFIALMSASCRGWRKVSCATLSLINNPPPSAWQLANNYGYSSRTRWTRNGQSRCASTAKGKCFAKSKTHKTGSFTVALSLSSRVFYVSVLCKNNDTYSSNDANRLSHTKQPDKLYPHNGYDSLHRWSL